MHPMTPPKWYFAIVVGLCSACAHKPVALAPPPAQMTIKWAPTASQDNLIYTDGVPTLISRLGGVTVGASLFAGKDFTRARIAVSNVSEYPTTIYPFETTVAVITPTRRVLGYYDPAKVVDNVNRKADIANFFAALGGSMAKQTITTTSHVDGTDRYGAWQADVVSTTTVPDVEAQRQAQQRIATNNIAAVLKADAISNAALRTTTIFPMKTVGGIILFERTRGQDQDVILRVYMGGVAFEFPFSLAKK